MKLFLHSKLWSSTSDLSFSHGKKISKKKEEHALNYFRVSHIIYMHSSSSTVCERRWCLVYASPFLCRPWRWASPTLFKRPLSLSLLKWYSWVLTDIQCFMTWCESEKDHERIRDIRREEWNVIRWRKWSPLFKTRKGENDVSMTQSDWNRRKKRG